MLAHPRRPTCKLKVGWKEATPATTLPPIIFGFKIGFFSQLYSQIKLYIFKVHNVMTDTHIHFEMMTII